MFHDRILIFSGGEGGAIGWAKQPNQVNTLVRTASCIFIFATKMPNYYYCNMIGALTYCQI